MLKKIKNIYHLIWALGSAEWYRHPDRKLTVIGITGTKGKTTSAYLIYYLLNQAGWKTALLSSVEIDNGKQRSPNKTGNTMPGRNFIQKWLWQSKRSGCRYAVLEVTSQGAVQNRNRFIDFDFACYTGLHPEHIEAHGGFDNYKAAKLSFFKAVAVQKNKQPVFFINQEDKYANEFAAAAGKNKITYYSPKEAAEINLHNLPGELNRGNIALALAVAQEAGLNKNEAQKIIEDFPGLPGRMEVVKRSPFALVIDYAYTPDSVRAAYETLARFKKNEANKIIAVFGSAGGGRDKWKRPVLGEIAAEHCDHIILTEEEPYDEDPKDIAEDIARGIKNKEQYQIITNREEAIRRSVEMAEAGDVVALLGKGPEPYIHYKNKKIPWDERGVAEKISQEKNLR